MQARMPYRPRGCPPGNQPDGPAPLRAAGHKSGRSKRRGAAAVEFAIVAPVFLIMIFGLVEFGRLVMVQQVITNASREGARSGILDGATTFKVQAVVDNYLQTAAISGAIVTVTPDPPGSAGFGQPVTVNVRVGFDKVSWMPSPFFLKGATLTSTTVMRRESYP